MHFNYYMPTRLIFGRGRLDELATRELPGQKALIVITNGKSMHSFGYLDRVINLLRGRHIDSVLFDKVLPNPTLKHVTEAADLARSENCDFIIGLGGGSAIDSAKAIAIAVNNPESYWVYAKKQQPVLEKVLPVIAIPTTAGTGTEADPWTVITNTETNEKVGFGVDATYPYLSIIDPELMLTVPSRLTAYQGMDALFHCIEGYMNKAAQPISDMLSLDSIRRLSEFLPVAVADGSNLQAREEVALASMQAGIVECTSGCISEHSMEHALSAFYPELPHGAGLVALSIPYFSRLLQKAPEKVTPRYIDMARAMGDIKANSGQSFLNALQKLIKNVGLSDLKLSDWGLKSEEAPELAKNSFTAMGVLYDDDPVELNLEDAEGIICASIH